MREDYGSLSLVTHDQGFGDMSFDAEPPELLRHGGGMEPSLDQVLFFILLFFSTCLMFSAHIHAHKYESISVDKIL